MHANRILVRDRGAYMNIGNTTGTGAGDVSNVDYVRGWGEGKMGMGNGNNVGHGEWE